MFSLWTFEIQVIQKIFWYFDIGETLRLGETGRIVKTKENTCKKHLLLCRFLASRAAPTFNRILREIIPVLWVYSDVRTLNIVGQSARIVLKFKLHLFYAHYSWHVDFLTNNFSVFLIVFLRNSLGDFFFMSKHILQSKVMNISTTQNVPNLLIKLKLYSIKGFKAF